MKYLLSISLWFSICMTVLGIIVRLHEQFPDNQSWLMYLVDRVMDLPLLGVGAILLAILILLGLLAISLAALYLILVLARYADSVR